MSSEMSELDSLVGEATILGEPVAWERPGQNHDTGNTFTPTKTKQAEGAIGWGWRQQVGPMRPDNESGFGVSVLFCSRGWRHRDIDNMLKTVLDGLTGVVWGNDKQVTELGHCAVRYGADVARIEIRIWRVPAQVNPKAPQPKARAR